MSQGSDSSNLYNHVYKGLAGGSTTSSSLPPQAIPTYKKDKKKFAKDNLDRLEEIGLRQLRKNIVFDEYYRMVEGDLAHTDYEEQPEILKGVADIREQADIPSYVRHFDLIGQIGRHLQGKYNDTKNKFRIDWADDIGTNEYDREFSNRIFKYTQKNFEIELELRLLKNGVSLKQEFESEEQQKQYQQYLQQQKARLATPPEIKSAMATDWKPIAAKWAQKALDRDRQRYNLDDLEREFFMDYYLTGRYFKHYRIGYDYYEPERWHPIETFFSEDYTLKYPQDAEYIGNIQNMSASQVANTFGHLMEESDLKKILNAYEYSSAGNSEDNTMSPQKILENNLTADSKILPHEDYNDRKSAVELQSALNTPLGEETYFDSEGNEVTKDAWIPDYEFSNTGLYNLSKHLRRDIDVREDSIRVMQAYWRSWDKIGLMYRKTETGVTTLDWVTDELNQDFLKEFDIKKVKQKSLTQFMNEYENGNLEPNSIVWTYAPIVWKGIKLNGTNSILEKDLYLDCEPLDFQIKGGKSNLYDVKLPVTGIITNSEAKKIRPYQIEYNYQMNLMHSLTEKEIGIFWLFDISMLPSDFRDLGDAEEILLNVRDMATDIGLVPLDMSKQNMKNRNSQHNNSFQAQDISFVPQIQQKMQMAQYYRNLALEQIGITEQDVKTPSEYATAEGIKIGQQNSFNQIEHLFEKMDNARLKDLEIGLAITQQAQVDDKDISLSYMSSDEEMGFVREVLSDENFKLRSFGLLPNADSQKRKELEKFKEYLLQSNTFQNDLSDIAEVLSSDSMSVVKKILKESYKERQKQEQAKQQQLERIEDKKLQAEKEKTQQEREYQLYKQDKELDNRIDVAHIQSMGRVRDVNEEEGDQEAVERAYENAKEQDKQEKEQQKIDLKKQDQKQKAKESMENIKLKLEDLKIKKEKNRLKEKEIEAKTFGDVINKN